jgi:hypothetical protein
MAHLLHELNISMSNADLDAVKIQDVMVQQVKNLMVSIRPRDQ